MQSPLSARLGQEDRRFLKATDKGHLLRECNYAAAADSIFQLNQNMETSNFPRTKRKERHLDAQTFSNRGEQGLRQDAQATDAVNNNPTH